MADTMIPRTPGDITSEWLTSALRGTGTIKKSAVTSFELDPDIAAGAGFMGQLARLKLHYDKPELNAPSSLIAKFPTHDPGNRFIADLFRM